MQENFITYNSKKLFYYTIGTGKIVLLIHGFGETSSIWNRTANQLSKHYKVIIPDLPGSGRSEILTESGTGNQILMEDYAAAMKAILDYEITLPVNALNQNVSIVGHSFGGYIGLEFIRQYPQIAQKLCLFHSSAYSDDDQKKETRKKAIEFISKNGIEMFLRSSIPDLFSEYSRNRFSEEIESLKGNSKAFNKEALIQYYNVMMNRKDHSELLIKTDLPVCFIIGEKDKAVPLEISLKQCHLPSISFVTILKNVGHMGMIEDFNRSLNSLYTFL